MTIAMLEKWKPEQLSSVADDLVKRRKTLLDLQDELDATDPPDNWVSDAGRAASKAHKKLGDDLRDMVAEVASTISHFDLAADRIRSAQRDLDSYLSRARSLGCTVNRQDGTVTGPRGEGAADVDQAQVTELAEGIGSALKRAAEADSDLATALNAARMDKIDGGEGSLAAAGEGTQYLSPKQRAWQTYLDARQDIANGTLPPFEQMTEQQREQFLRDNPDLVDLLMQVKEPGEQLQRDIIALALPSVTSGDARADARDVLESVDGKASPAQFLAAMDDLADGGDGMGALAAWAEREGIDLSGNSRVADVRGYQQQFLDDTAGRSDDISAYIADNEHRWDTGQTREAPGPRSGDVPVFDTVGGFTPTVQSRMLGAYGDAILSVSNEELGGRWEDLPQQVRDDISHDPNLVDGKRPGPEFDRIAQMLQNSNEGLPPGDTLAAELANSVQHSLYNGQGFTGPPGDQDYGFVGVPGEKGLGSVLEVVSRNHEATAVLLGTDPADLPNDAGSGYDDFTGDVPESFNSGEFVKNVYSYHWDDNGAAAASLTNWMDEAFTAGERSPDYALAEQGYNGLTSTLTSTGEGGIFKDLMDTLGKNSDSAGAANPELIRSLQGVTEHENVLERMAVEESPDQIGRDVRLSMLIAGDQQAGERMVAAAGAYNGDVLLRNMSGDLTDSAAAGRMGNLTGLMETGLFNEAYERTGDAQLAATERADSMKAGLSMLSSLVPDPTGASGVSSSLLSQFISAENVEPVDPRLSPDWSEEGNHALVSAYDSVLARMHADGTISDADYQRVLGEDNMLDRLGASENLLRENGYSPDLNSFNNEYTARLNNWVASGDGSELEDLIRHGTMPGPG